MSITGAIVDYFDNGNDGPINSLRYAVGEDKMWADQAPAYDPDAFPVTMPYIVVIELSDVPEVEGKDLSWRLDLVSVQFSVFATSRQNAEEVLTMIEDAYLVKVLSINGRDQVGVPRRGTRQTVKDPAENVWHGFVEITYRVEHTY